MWRPRSLLEAFFHLPAASRRRTERQPNDPIEGTRFAHPALDRPRPSAPQASTATAPEWWARRSRARTSCRTPCCARWKLPFPIGRSTTLGWLFRIAHNLALDLLRRRAASGTEGEETWTSSSIPSTNWLVARLRRRRCRPSCNAGIERSVVILFDVLEYSAEEVSEISAPGASREVDVAAWTRTPAGIGRAVAGEARPFSSAERRSLQRMSTCSTRATSTRFARCWPLTSAGPGESLATAGSRRRRILCAIRADSGWRAWAGRVEGRPQC